MNRTRWTLAAILSRYLAMAVSAIVSFATVPIVLKHVSKADYGLWIAIGEAVGYFVILDFGTGSAITRMVARMGPDPRKLSRLYSTALFVSILFSLLFLGAGFALTAVLPHWRAIPPGRVSLARNLVLLMSVRGALTFPIRIAANTLVGLQRQAFVNLTALLGVIAAPVTYVLLFQHGTGLIALPIGMLVGTAVGSIPPFLVLKAAVPALHVSFRDAHWNEAKSLFSWSLLLFINNIAVMMIYYTDNLVIASNLNLASVTVYTLTSRLLLYWHPLLMALSDSTLPALVDLYRVGSLARFREVFMRVLRFIAACAAGLAVIASCVNGNFVAIWTGEAQNYGGLAMTLIFAFIMIDRAVRQVNSLVLLSTGRIRGVVWMSVLEATLNLGLSLALVRFFGGLGVAAGTMLAACLTSSWYVPIIVASELKMPVWRYLAEAFLGPLLAGLGAAALAMALKPFMALTRWPSLILYSGLVGLGYVSLLALLEFRRNGWKDWSDLLRVSRFWKAAPEKTPVEV